MNIFKKLFNLIKTSSNNEANLPVTREEYEALKQKISELEQRQLEDRKFKEFLESHIKKKNLEHKIDEYLHELSIDVNPSTRKAAIEGLKIIDVVNSYGFSKYVPDIKKEYNTRVISIDDLRKNPENYLFKLHKGFLNFPLGIDFSYVNSVLFENFGCIRIFSGTSYSNNGNVGFTTSFLLENYEPPQNRELQKFVKEVFHQSELSLYNDPLDSWIEIDTIDFLKNYDAIIRFITDLHENSPEYKKKMLRAFEATRTALMCAVELTLKSTIREPADLLTIVDEEYKTPPNELEKLDLKHNFYELLLQEPKGCSYSELKKYLPIKSKKLFYDLASKRTLELLSRRSNSNGLEKLVKGADLGELSTGELILFSVYFSRYIIEEYQDLDNAVENIFQKKLTKSMSGKCTDYSALSIHYLNEYLKKLYPDKFSNWRFGITSDVIDSYRHAYLKAIHINPDYSIDIIFLDPTKLAKYPLEKIKTPEEIVEKVNALDLPLLIDRNAEDLLYRKE